MLSKQYVCFTFIYSGIEYGLINHLESLQLPLLLSEGPLDPFSIHDQQKDLLVNNWIPRSQLKNKDIFEIYADNTSW